ncbi:hypothetical protein B0H15DRAFT_953623 [Mycena belliarum]|uniref:Uncharacterized protein n=1 Tax=Mycena belliarum TaxID=1033014 RepID=A0AAD6TV37_9AGAR|nr:hypothetical protein B0H15DRAFT_953623 [Mycena belliae]
MSSLLQISCRRQQQVRASTNNNSENIPSSPSIPSSSNMDSPNPFSTPSTPSLISALLPRTQYTSAQRAAFGLRALKQVKLGEPTERLFKRYLETEKQEERDVLQFLYTLEAVDLISGLLEHRGQEWQPSSELLKKIRKFVKAILILPDIRYYAGAVEVAVIQAMRDSGVAQLPDADSDDMDGLKSTVARQLTLDRSTLKSLVKRSMSKPVLDMASLAVQILSKFSGSKTHTLGLYQRLSLIRYHLGKNHPVDKFWAEVDSELDELHKAGPTEYVMALQACYDDDMIKFPGPSDSDSEAVRVHAHKFGDEIGDTSPKWLRMLSKNAKKIHRIDVGSRGHHSLGA